MLKGIYFASTNIFGYWHIARLNSLSQVSFISKGDTSYIYAHQGAAQ